VGPPDQVRRRPAARPGLRTCCGGTAVTPRPSATSRSPSTSRPVPLPAIRQPGRPDRPIRRPLCRHGGGDRIRTHLDGAADPVEPPGLLPHRPGSDARRGATARLSADHRRRPGHPRRTRRPPVGPTRTRHDRPGVRPDRPPAADDGRLTPGADVGAVASGLLASSRVCWSWPGSATPAWRPASTPPSRHCSPTDRHPRGLRTMAEPGTVRFIAHFTVDDPGRYRPLRKKGSSRS